MTPGLAFVVRRGAWAAATLFVALAATFALVALTPDPNAALAGFAAAAGGGDAEAAMSAYEAARNLDEPVLDRFLGFVRGAVTLDLGRSLSSGEPVRSILVDRALVSLSYVVPAAVVSVAGGVLVGATTALRDSSLGDRLTGAAAYLGLSVPNFWLAALGGAYLAAALGAGGSFDPEAGLFASPNVQYLAIAAAVLATTMFAAQLRYTQAEMGAFADAEFVRLVRAKGGNTRRVARHVLRNAAPPLVSLFVTELLATLFVAVVVVESVLGIPGVGAALLEAVSARDLPMVMGVTLFVVAVGVFARFAQDVLRATLDPRL
ncbi:ABC transporter permease [Halosegnis marinus]|uniref:ABC transporter permease n=1 Tax=Halosegnis marinus TaxID=3034023 RepID=A0ABD5ZPA7_9EURY|nr:ABC transporter permease [Halosegnis sp. DT85]